jgi:hypothetical protein
MQWRRAGHVDSVRTGMAVGAPRHSLMRSISISLDTVHELGALLHVANSFRESDAGLNQHQYAHPEMKATDRKQILKMALIAARQTGRCGARACRTDSTREPERVGAFRSASASSFR